MSPTVDPRSNSNISVETVNATLLDRTTALFAPLNAAIGFEGTGAKNFTIYQNGSLEEITLAIHKIEANSNDAPWIEAQNVFFQAAPDRLNEIKEKLEKNIDNIKDEIANNVENLFAMIQGKETEFNPLEAALSNASSIEEVLAEGRNLENSILDFDRIARDIAEIYFSNQFNLGNLELKIEEEIFSLLGKEGQEYSNGTTNAPKYFFSFQRRDVSKEDVYARFTNEIKTSYEEEHGENSWTKENYLKKMFENKQIELSASTIKAILADKNRKQNEFKHESEILALVTNFDDLLRIVGANQDNRNLITENLFREHLTKYTPPTLLIDSSDSGSFIEQGIKQLATYTKDAYGDTFWDTNTETYSINGKNLQINFEVLSTSLLNQIAGGKLKLDPVLIEKIIQEKNISQEDLSRFRSSADFLRILTAEELFSIAGKHYGIEGDEKGIKLKLFEYNLKANTPIYYEDDRSVYDFLAGKSNDNGDSNNINKIFTSLENQIRGIGKATKNLLSQGYDKPPKNQLQAYLRANPLEAAIYLENFLTNNESLNESERSLIENYIKKMMGRFTVLIQEQMNESNKDSKDTILNLQQAVTNYKPTSGNNISFIKQKFDELNTNVKDKFNFQAWPESLNALSSENLSLVLGELKEDSKFFNTHKALYAAESQEANKINAQHYGKKLPEGRADGTFPETNEPIAPTIGPSFLSSVIASIGNQALERANSIINGDYPNTNWLTEKSSFLRKLDSDLQTLPSDTTRSQQFISALKATFIPIIKKFLENKSDTKLLADSAKNNLSNNLTNIKRINILNGTDSGFNFDMGNLDSELSLIEADLPGLMNPDSINLNNNKICRAGLDDTKTFLETSARELQNQILNPPQGANLEDLQNKLSKIYDLLYGDNGNSSNPSTGSILERIINYNQNIDSACSNKPEGTDRLSYLTNKQGELINEYKSALINFSNDITSIEDDDIDIKKAFKDAIENASSDFDGDGDLDPALDSDGNGVNDFQDLKNLANMISGGANSLANTLENVFGSSNETGKNIKTMGIRRLILMMLLFTIFESSDWDSQRQEADVTKYQVD